MLIRRPPQMEQGLVVLNPNVDKNMFFIIIKKIFNSGVWSMSVREQFRPKGLMQSSMYVCKIYTHACVSEP